MPDDSKDATTVLVVEDDFDLCDALVPILEYEGHRVVSAANGREALDRLQAMPPPSVILLDLMMPVMDGWQFREEQLHDPKLAGIPVVIVSGQGLLMRQAPAHGVSEVLRKPLELRDLLTAVERHVHSP